MAFTKLVRPFLLPNTSPAPTKIGRTSASGATTAPDTVILRLGEGAQGRVVTTSFREFVGLYMEKQQRELEENPDN